MMIKNKICLIVLDGYGIGENDLETNAIYAANPKFINELFSKYPHIKLHASGPDVGLESNQFGNSEVGHLTIGSGRIFLNVNSEINEALNSEKLGNFLNPLLQKDKTNVVNIIGIYSSGLVHGNKEHIDQLIKYFENLNYKINLHLFSDGRDSLKEIFYDDLKSLMHWIRPTTKIVSISGRFYSMDRDNNLERTTLAFAAINLNSKNYFNNPLEYIKKQYDLGIDDEHIYPAYLKGETMVNLNDEFNIITNYRPDRILQMSRLFSKNKINFVLLNQFSEFSNHFSLIKPDGQIKNNLDQILFNNGFKQLRIAETEKYAHVTYFFDGGQLSPNSLKKEILIPSEKITDHAEIPSMKAVEIADYVIQNAQIYDFILVNFANPDMLGHTGNFLATKKGIQIIDEQIKKIYNTIVKDYNYTLMITSDHGNADLMKIDGVELKTHTLALVPFLITDKSVSFKKQIGRLSEIAPTILDYLHLNKPKEMTDNSLLSGENDAR